MWNQLFVDLGRVCCEERGSSSLSERKRARSDQRRGGSLWPNLKGGAAPRAIRVVLTHLRASAPPLTTKSYTFSPQPT